MSNPYRPQGDVPQHQSGLGGQTPPPLNAPLPNALSLGVQPGPQSPFVRAIQVVITGGNSSGVFVYSPMPGPGNLIVSIAAAAGTDAFGNAYGPGVIAYGPGPSTRAEIGFQVTGAGTPGLGFASGAASETRSAQLDTNVFNPNTVNETIQLNIFGPLGASQDSPIIILVDSPSTGAGTSTGFLHWVDTAGGQHDMAYWGQHGFTGAITQKMVGAQPGTINTTITAETWHTISPVAGFAAGGTTPRYRYEPVGSAGIVRLAGVVSLTANQAANTTFFTLPAGWVPSVAQNPLVGSNLSGVTAIAADLTISTGGVMQIAQSGSTGNVIVMDGVTFPLD